MIELERLKQLLNYDQNTGIWKWLLHTGRSEAGSIAGSLSNGYIRISIDGRKYMAHVLAWFYMTGKWPLDELDHIDLDKSNNRWHNLRLATRSQNNTNKERYRNNTSGYKGISWYEKGKCWRAKIQKDRKQIHLGSFSRIEDAILAYKKAAKEFHEEFTPI